MTQWDLDLLSLTWHNPATGTTILDEDMPWELQP